MKNVIIIPSLKPIISNNENSPGERTRRSSMFLGTYKITCSLISFYKTPQVAFW